MLLVPLTANVKVPAGGFVAKINKQLKLGELRMKLAEKLDVPYDGLSQLMSDGRDLDDGLTMQENNLVLPGPAARGGFHALGLLHHQGRHVT